MSAGGPLRSSEHPGYGQYVGIKGTSQGRPCPPGEDSRVEPGVACIACGGPLRAFKARGMSREVYVCDDEECDVFTLTVKRMSEICGGRVDLSDKGPLCDTEGPEEPGGRE